MDEFLKFKRKIQLESLFKALAAGIGIALLAVGATLLTFKLSGNSIPFWIYIIEGLVIFLVAGGLAYLITTPNDLRIAKRLDKSLGLNQRVQTMIEYKDRDGFMLDIQREDTNKLLGGIEAKSLKYHFHFVYGIILALGLGLSITSFAIPARAMDKGEIIEPTPTDPELEEDPYMVQAIKELIKEVKDSTTSLRFKNATIKQLEGLIEVVIDPETTVNNAKLAVEALLAQMEMDLKTSNTAAFIYDILRANDDPNVANIVRAYSKLDVLGLAHQLDSLRLQLTEGTDEVKSRASREPYIAFAETLANSKLNQQALYSESPLMQATIQLGTDLKEYNTLLLNGKFIDMKKVNAFMDVNKKAMVEALTLQLNDVTIADHVRKTLLELFEMLEDEDVERPSRPDIPSIDPSEDETEKGDNDGGYGGGSILFGSDDQFFDPVLGYVKYGDVINAYQAIIDKDIQDGVLTQEMIEFYRDYYERLMTNKENK